MTARKIGFIRFGALGTGLAESLVRAGFVKACESFTGKKIVPTG